MYVHVVATQLLKLPKLLLIAKFELEEVISVIVPALIGNLFQTDPLPNPAGEHVIVYLDTRANIVVVYLDTKN